MGKGSFNGGVGRRSAQPPHDDLRQGLALLAVDLDILGQRPPESVAQLRERVQALAARARELSSSLHQDGPHPRDTGLSPRQRQVLRLLAGGHSMKAAARILKITPRTVAFHKYAMMEELGIRTSAELIRYAVQQQIVGGC